MKTKQKCFIITIVQFVIGIFVAIVNFACVESTEHINTASFDDSQIIKDSYHVGDCEKYIVYDNAEDVTSYYYKIGKVTSKDEQYVDIMENKEDKNGEKGAIETKNYLIDDLVVDAPPYDNINSTVTKNTENIEVAAGYFQNTIHYTISYSSPINASYEVWFHDHVPMGSIVKMMSNGNTKLELFSYKSPNEDVGECE